MKLSYLFVALLAVVGCKNKDDAGAAGGGGGGDDCGSVIPAAVDRIMPEMAKSMAALPPEKVAQLGPKMKEVLLAHCVADKWPAEHLKCLAAGKTNEEMKACDKTLPADAKDKLTADLGKAMKGIIDLSGAPGSMGKLKRPDDGAGSAAEGSAAAAGSGSGS